MKLSVAERRLWTDIIEIRAKLDGRWKAIIYADRIVEAFRDRGSSLWEDIVKIRATIEGYKKAISYADRIVEAYDNRDH